MNRFIKSIIVVILVLAVLIFFIWIFSSIFIYLVISIILSTILRPLTNYLSIQQFFNLRMPRVLAVFISFLTLILLLSAFVTLFLPLISDQIQIFSSIDLEQVIAKIEIPLEALESFILKYQMGDYEKGFLALNVKEGIKNLVKEVEVASIVENVISVTGNVFVGLMAITFITFFLLYEKGILRKHLINLIPNEYFEVSIAGLYKIERLLSNYLLGLLLQMTAIFSIAFTGLSIFGINYAASIALFAAVINLVPYLGPILGATFGILVGLSTTGVQIFEGNQFIIMTIEIASVFAIVQLTDNVILQPLIFSKSVKAHPLEIFIIIFAGATLAGVVGMIAAIPVYTIIRVFVMEIYSGYKSYHIFKV
ncbi:MAG: AI-2E family transporter [Cyclobacteriaceae bacterium]|nr:AI-2E family transporter [Cyclobacteriaceae bacterium]MCK5467370.1 AI-2E family transporter [Cyclobacteriaceae bacterium]